MYLRTTSRKNKDGSVVKYYQLAHNERHPDTGKPVARIIHSFGRADQLDRDHLVRLCQSIARVCGLQLIDPLSDADDRAVAASTGLPESLKLIRTLTISVADAARGYKGLMIIERCFRSLKRTQIKLTPMFHWVPRRIETHVKICVLALLIERIAEIRCDEPWSHIRRGLEQLQISYFTTNESSFYRRNEIPSKARNILKQMKISAPKLVYGLEKQPETP